MRPSLLPCKNTAHIFALTEQRSLSHSWNAVTNNDFIGEADDTDRWGAIPGNTLYPNRLAAGVVAWPALPHPHGHDFQKSAESDGNGSNHLVSKLEATLGPAATTEQKELLESLRRNLANTQAKTMQSNQRASSEGPLKFERTYGAGIA